MKLLTQYEKRMSYVIARVIVSEAGDYQISKIFENGKSDRIQKEFKTVEQAKAWVDTEIVRIKKGLAEWRAIKLPASESVIL